MGGNITRDGITKDLESMKSHGVVQATIFNIGEIYTKKVDIPLKPSGLIGPLRLVGYKSTK